MRQERGNVFWKAGAMALTTGLLAATAWAQPPAPPAAPVSAPAPAPAPVSFPTTVEVPGVYCPPRSGLGAGIGGAIQHAGHALQDGVIGYPNEFDEPPLGFYLHQTYKSMSAKADPHRFTLYRTDFLPGTNRFSPVGATRFNLMASRISLWPGAIVIEWSPDEPGLAEARRAAVVSTFQRAHLPVAPERVMIAPSPYPGAWGDVANHAHTNFLSRDQKAASLYSESPTSASGFGAGGGGSSGSR